MNTEQLNQQFEPIYRANPDAVKSYMEIIADSVCIAIKKQAGPFTDAMLFEQVRPSIPNAADLGICPALADGLARLLIAQTIEQLSFPEAERNRLSQIAETMKKHGFKTAGEATAYLHRQQIN